MIGDAKGESELKGTAGKGWYPILNPALIQQTWILLLQALSIRPS